MTTTNTTTTTTTKTITTKIDEGHIRTITILKEEMIIIETIDTKMMTFMTIEECHRYGHGDDFVFTDVSGRCGCEFDAAHSSFCVFFSLGFIRRFEP
jgi:hypothetical protein